MAIKIYYKGFLISSHPRKTNSGKFMVTGNITDIQNTFIDVTPFFGQKEYAVEEKADKAFISFAKQHIDNM
jgi:hypothetical protein